MRRGKKSNFHWFLNFALKQKYQYFVEFFCYAVCNIEYEKSFCNNYPNMFYYLQIKKNHQSLLGQCSVHIYYTK